MGASSELIAGKSSLQAGCCIEHQRGFLLLGSDDNSLVCCTSRASSGMHSAFMNTSRSLIEESQFLLSRNHCATLRLRRRPAMNIGLTQAVAPKTDTILLPTARHTSSGSNTGCTWLVRIVFIQLFTISWASSGTSVGFWTESSFFVVTKRQSVRALSESQLSVISNLIADGHQ